MSSSKTPEAHLDDVLPSEIYGESDSELCEALMSDLFPTTQQKWALKTNNAAVIAGPPTITWNGRNLLMIYPIPCRVIREFEDTQLLVQLAWPYNDIYRRYPSILIEKEYAEISKAEKEYMDKVECSDLGYHSLRQIQNDQFQ